jgi:hypothetical protein
MADFDASPRFGRRIARKSDAYPRRDWLLYQELEIGGVTFDRADALDATALSGSTNRNEVRGNRVDGAI